MAGPSGCLEIEARDGVAPRDDGVVGMARLGHQHIFVAGSLRLDEVARRWRADLLVRREQHGDRQAGRDAGTRELPDRLQGEIIAALHVENAGAVASVALAPPFELFDGADGMHGVEMARDQDAGLTLRRMRKTRTDAAAEALPAGDAFDRGAH